MKTAIITDNGEQLEVSMDKARIIEFLVKRELIYACPECGENHYHLSDGVTFEQIEERIT